VKELHVVFGARGALGTAIVRQLDEAGKHVRAIVREEDVAHCALPGHTEVVHGDPIHRRRAIEAAEGATIVYRCMPMQIHQWTEMWLPVTENIIAAAREAKARLVSPGSLYVYGPLQHLPATEDHPQSPVGEKGRLRVATQHLLFEADRSGHVPVVIPRFADVFGPCVLTPFHGMVFYHALRDEPVRWIGKLDNLRDLTFIEDAARACILLGDHPETFGQVWHVPGPGAVTSGEFIRMIYEAAGHHPKVHHLSATAMQIEGLVDPEMMALVEFRYRFEQPQLLDGTKFHTAFPDFRYTPLREGVERTLEWFGRHYLG
jgi:nucleoside-diphosphate-sugar epimerase